MVATLAAGVPALAFNIAMEETVTVQDYLAGVQHALEVWVSVRTALPTLASSALHRTRMHACDASCVAPVLHLARGGMVATPEWLLLGS